jgi:hypothetical protein
MPASIVITGAAMTQTLVVPLVTRAQVSPGGREVPVSVSIDVGVETSSGLAAGLAHAEALNIGSPPEIDAQIGTPSLITAGGGGTSVVSGVLRGWTPQPIRRMTQTARMICQRTPVARGTQHFPRPKI